MDEGNLSTLSEFILMGLGHSWSMQVLLFMLFLLLYLITVSENIVTMTLISTDPHLHPPMYFFLAKLFFVDTWLSSITTPKIITNFLREKKTISFAGCRCQIFFTHLTAAFEMVLLVSMAYDRYVAICKPLHYSTIMNLQRCTGISHFSLWLGAFAHSIVQVALILHLPFGGPNQLDNFFWDVPQVIKLACTDTFVVELLMVSNSGQLTLLCFLGLLATYAVILCRVKGHSSEGKSKAISTCKTHIIVVSLMFGPPIFIYTRPFQVFPSDKVVFFFHIVIFPLLNPVIYTLRNQEVRASMIKLLSQYVVC
ncbi:olfactory receptor 4N5-like [Callospermophilus lateralis]|uniref:olfactory receptor 4N5-like n=1 Tax=Callospermophilus lateralis TaxID=76772 RepID=UPI004053C1A5